MKKLILIGLLLTLLAVPAFADGLGNDLPLKLLPALKQGVGFSVIDSKWNYLATIELIKWNELALEGGYMGDGDSTDHKAVAVISYPLLKLKDYFDVPLAEYVTFNLGIYAGYGRITGNNEFDYGASLTAISFKF